MSYTTAPPLLHFVHTSDFDGSAAEIPLEDAELRELQDILRNDPTAGDAIPGTGGIRKLRLSAKGKGTRGGSRVIYFYVASRLRAYLLLAYDKSQSDDLSAAGKRYLCACARAFEEEP